MPVESDADRASFLDVDEFGVAATYTPNGGDPVTVNGIFDNEYEEVGFGDVGLESSSPAFTCRESDVTGVAQGDALVINSVNYLIRNPQPDATGMVVLILEKQ